MNKNSFDKVLLDAVDSTLASLGDSAKQSIYFHLKKSFDVSREDIPSRVEDFDKGLERIFGTGTRFLEVLIMKKLYEEIGPKGKIKLDQGKDFKFVDYVRAAHRAYSEA